MQEFAEHGWTPGIRAEMPTSALLDRSIDRSIGWLFLNFNFNFKIKLNDQTNQMKPEN
jgi:hypothetical protein